MALPSSGIITLAQIQAEFGGANPISLSEYYKGGAYVTASDIAPNVPYSGIISLSNFHGAFKNVIGQIAYTTPGTYTWTVPAGVSSVCVVCIGSGNGSGSLSWGNNIPVSAGQQFTIKVGDAASGISYFGSTGILYAGTGADRGGAYAGGGGNGGATGSNFGWQAGGGGAGGYTGNGGAGGNVDGFGGNGAGGGGGGGYGGSSFGAGYPAAGGGGTGILGQGGNGASGGSGGGYGGSGGQKGGDPIVNEYEMYRGAGGIYGGGIGASGAVRIIWGAYRSFPSTNTGNL